MPTEALKSMAEKHGVSMPDAERYWDEAVDSADKQGFTGDRKYAYAMGIVKKRMGITSSVAQEIILAIETSRLEKHEDVIASVQKRFEENAEIEQADVVGKVPFNKKNLLRSISFTLAIKKWIKISETQTVGILPISNLKIDKIKILDRQLSKGYPEQDFKLLTADYNKMLSSSDDNNSSNYNPQPRGFTIFSKNVDCSIHVVIPDLLVIVNYKE